MLLKPQVQSRKEHRMTLIIGMECQDCLLFAADREESTEYGGKRSVSKIHQGQGRNWSIAIATAGSSAVSDLAALHIISNAKEQDDFAENPFPVVRDAMAAIYDRYIFPRDEKRQRERDITLIIGIKNDETDQTFLFRTTEEIVKPESHYACAGAGQEIAYYFLDRVHGDAIPGDEAMTLTAFLLREAKSSVGGVGNESEFLRMNHRGQYKGLSGRSLIGQALDWRDIPHLRYCLTPFWRKSQNPS